MAEYLISRALAIDAETGVLSVAAELLTAYLELPAVEKFYTGTLQVLHRMIYEYAREPVPKLRQFYKMQPEEAVEVLIVDPEVVVRDLQMLVEPYIRVRDVELWKCVWSRLSALPFVKIVEVVKGWTPPEEVREGFAKWALTMCYRCSETSGRVLEGMHVVTRRVAEVVEVGDGELPETLGELGDHGNPLFTPSRATLGFLDVVITSAGILGKPVAETARIRLDGGKELQMAVLKQFVRAGSEWNKRSDEEWRKVRDRARWLLHDSKVLGQLTESELEHTLLAGMLSATRFALVKDIYINNPTPLPLDTIESTVVDAFSNFFDSATNGNRTRGSMKNADQCIQILYPQHQTPALIRANHLISAAHALSTYRLTLTPGVPLKPVQLRIHPDPLSLLARLLDSNPKSYQHPESLITIGKDLAHGIISANAPPSETIDEDVESRVLGMTIEAALTEDDFETAYAYITSRLLPAATASSPVDSVKDTLWRTALMAGRYQSQYSSIGGVAKGPRALALLEKKKELLALAIRFAPVDAVPGLLIQWEKCDDEVDALLEAESKAEEEHARLGGERVVREESEEGPQSLFEVAKGAARVFGGVGRGIVPGAVDGESGSQKDGVPGGRKRDVVADVVTQGLASGLGWVLGAQPKA